MNISRIRLQIAVAAAVGFASASNASAAIILPDLTSGGTASSTGGNFGDGPAISAFDDSATTKVGLNSPTGDISATAPVFVRYTFSASSPGGASAIVRSYSITSANDSDFRDPRDFRLEASNDNFATAGVVLDTRVGIMFTDTDGVQGNRFETLFFTVQAPGTVPFSSYQLVTTETRNGDTNNAFQVAEVQFFDTVVVPEPASLGLLATSGLLLLARRRR